MTTIADAFGEINLRFPYRVAECVTIPAKCLLFGFPDPTKGTTAAGRRINEEFEDRIDRPRGLFVRRAATTVYELTPLDDVVDVADDVADKAVDVLKTAGIIGGGVLLALALSR